jgi:hypothetical protein
MYEVPETKLPYKKSQIWSVFAPVDKTTSYFTKPRDIQWYSLGNRQTTWSKYLVVLNLAQELLQDFIPRSFKSCTN